MTLCLQSAWTTVSTSSFKRWTSALFYRLINQIGSTQITPGAADFRLLTRQVVEALCSMPEYHRFLRGMVAWVGYKSVILPYTPPPRMAGKSKYSLGKMLRLSMDAIFSFSLVPLYIGISLGVLMLLLALVEMIYVLSFWVTGNISNLAPGWSSLMFILLMVGGFLMISIGVIGVYIGYIFQEVKGRPVYLVREPADGPDNNDSAINRLSWKAVLYSPWMAPLGSAGGVFCRLRHSVPVSGLVLGRVADHLDCQQTGDGWDWRAILKPTARTGE